MPHDYHSYFSANLAFNPTTATPKCLRAQLDCLLRPWREVTLPIRPHALIARACNTPVVISTETVGQCLLLRARSSSFAPCQKFESSNDTTLFNIVSISYFALPDTLFLEARYPSSITLAVHGGFYSQIVHTFSRAVGVLSRFIFFVFSFCSGFIHFLFPLSPHTHTHTSLHTTRKHTTSSPLRIPLLRYPF